MPLFRLALRALLVGALPSWLAAQAPVSTAAQQVRSARARYNDAIATRDMAAMAAALAPAYHLVAGRSAQSHGIEAMQARWASAFAGDSLYACVRTPDAIMPNVSWGLAQERGTWHCTYAGVPKGAKPGRATGVYDAKWQRDVSGTWRLQAEVFTTLTCEGGSASCIPPDAIAGTPRGTAYRNAAPDNMVRAVRAARTAYNDAIARGEADTIAALFAPGYHAVFGRGTHIEDDSTARADWQQEFRDNGPGSCVRTPDEIVVNGSWAIAHERGTWQCRIGRGRDRIRPSGSYVAKWQRDGAGQWRVQTEVFTTLRCEGAAAKCEPPAPLPTR